MIDVEVARNYDEHPLQLAHDFPQVSQRRLWRHIETMLDVPNTPSGAASVAAPDTAGTLDAVEALNATGHLPGAVRRRWAAREAQRLRRARQLGLPEENPNPFASDAEVRRALMKVI